ncbi:YciI family protein [Jiangella rhizosphaerae]|uniref:YciI family protein n=1 Tax=Jiangella rhizosphaerae TaxID=2293569 RepID=A0A418KV14_9ACTN|nr:YciI family protein [Jiangella rhizosphaerae]RIQ32534.1 YciI family protein [Jiangella rhizosphaerae]
MQYLLLIYLEPPAEAPDQAQLDAQMAEWWAYDDAIRKSGVYVDANALEPATTATTLRLKDGERVVTDGPFAETREVLGGYYLVDVPDLDTALDWAAKCPGAKYGSMEIRPTTVFERD